MAVDAVERTDSPAATGFAFAKVAPALTTPAPVSPGQGFGRDCHFLSAGRTASGDEERAERAGDPFELHTGINSMAGRAHAERLRR